ncbi:hypothetical protein KWL24_019250 [Clostridioides difficile]|uniref:hypothetical protein n=1 Tax=Clostridioides difficile TaxID=1496 RepID=UPI00111319F4|nr:hypothetical protein [Clostridioides difficile]MBF4710560.1 hypothetical protein [Clostridioides difficile]MBY1443971.1 hypothetical protein [Clostridioides difficile]MBZ0592847.1 hypothetical protein [Clostridioides difficile]MCL6924918.1 hypothetical protein [Clostridioides difficile]MDE3516451.1 hypothetical protein [Clostridioides difficile]
MGEQLSKSNEKNIKSGGAGGKSTSTTGAGATKTGAGTETGTGKSSGEEKLPKLVSVEVPGESEEERKKREERNQKRREKYASQKNNTTKKTSKKKEIKAIDTTQINVLIETVSAIIASRPGWEIWRLSTHEIEQITIPLVNILKKSEAFDGLGEYADHIALAVACITIIAPRLIITLQKQKEAKKFELTRQRTDTRPTKVDKTGEVVSDSKPVTRPTTDNNKNDGSDLSAIIPSIM